MICRKYKYDVSFSFAEEDVDFVAEVAEHLKKHKPDYYFYKEDLVSSWGKDLRKYLSPIYRRQSRLCVIFISSAYREKVWTKFEFREAQIKAKKGVHEYILPFKIDDTELPEIHSTIKRLLRKDFDAQGLADVICLKIDKHKEEDTFRSWLYGIARYYLTSRLHLTALAILSVTAVTGWYTLRDRLTPVDVLAARLYDEGKERIKGSICRDGWFSKKRRNGTCSSHFGVLKPVDTVLPGKTFEQCQEEAKDISWLDE